MGDGLLEKRIVGWLARWWLVLCLGCKKFPPRLGGLRLWALEPILFLERVFQVCLELNTLVTIASVNP